MKKSIITTERLTLRKLKKEDNIAWLRIFNSAEVGQFIHRIEDLDTINKIIDKIIKKYADNLGECFSIIENKTNQIIGNIGLKYDFQYNSAEISYVIDKNFWNKGFATESARALIKYAFIDLQIKRIIADARADNYASNRILSNKLSMKLIDSKTNKDGIMFNFYAINSDDYKNLSKNIQI